MSRSSSLGIRAFLALGFLLLAAQRLPAPIVEESPQQKPKPSRQTGPAHSESKQTQTSKKEPAVSFAGTWTGSATGRINQALIGETGFSSNYKIQISADERTASWTSSAWLFATFQAPVQKKGRTLNWTTERHDLAGTTTVNCRLEVQTNGTARYSESSGLVNGAFKGKGYEISGVLVRQ
ncbi:MAG TPA: hypothetical protein VFA58_08955 [Chthoniobacterales bacterium]|nr:hypothetical protein [Chthoniobacterales bacterium]